MKTGKLKILLLPIASVFFLSLCGCNAALPETEKAEINQSDILTRIYEEKQSEPAFPEAESSGPEGFLPDNLPDISQVSFFLENFEEYILFDMDGMEIPELKALFDETAAAYQDNVMDTPGFYLETAQYDLNDDGIMEYIVKYPDYDRSGAMRAAEGFLDIVYRLDGKLKRMDLKVFLYNTQIQCIILETTMEGFHDIVVLGENSNYKRLYKYNGTEYEQQDFTGEERIWTDRILTTDDTNAELDGNILKLRYSLRMWYGGPECRFSVAGYFITAEKTGVLKERRLWACDESGRPAVWSSKECPLWIDVMFWGEYGGADLNDFKPGWWAENEFTDRKCPVWPDDIEIVIQEP